MSSQEGFKALQTKVQEALVKTVKSANQIAAEDLSFQRTVDPSVGDKLDDKTERMLSLSSKLLKVAAQVCGQDEVPELEDADDVDMQWRKIVDVVDSVLERADRAMDEFTGALKRKDAPSGDAAQQTKKPKTMLANNMRHANMTKPQLAFERPVDNDHPWKPVLTKKPHSTVSLQKSLATRKTESGFVENKHPYESEISESKYPAFVYEKAEPILYQPVQTTTAVWVDTFEGVLEMLKELKKAKEIAVDLEHHDSRTYSGLLSLMQISTRDKDWIVDTLKPWRHQLEVLNEVFADPSILKVFHGAHMDMQWLQRDLGLYINGLFDTYFACQTLGYPQRSLAYLLKRFVDFDADKKYQMADWRIRPLPEEMFYYARSDTHYLLYIYDLIRNELIKASDRTNPQSDYIEQVLQKSKELSLSRYEGANYNPETGHGSRGWYGLLLKNPVPLSGPQFAVYRALWKWRDEKARSMDESTFYVLSNATILDISRTMPPDAKALHSMIPNNSFIARRSVNDIWAAYQEAKEAGVNGPSLYEFFKDDPAVSGDKRTQKKILQQAPVVPDDAESPRLEGCQLFGGVSLSSKWAKQEATPANDRVLLPWQRIAQNAAANVIVEAADVPMVEESPQPAARAPTKAQPEEVADEEFTLKGSQKRKAPVDDTSSEEESDDDDDDTSAAADQPSPVEEEIAMDDEEEKAARERAELKAAKKQAKRALRAERKAQAAESEDSGDDTPSKKSVSEPDFDNIDKAEKKRRKELKKQRREAKAAKKAAREAAQAEAQDGAEEAFDYSKASSVLHAGRSGDARQTRGKKFDPYKKLEVEGVKAARKAPPLHGGRSATFKK